MSSGETIFVTGFPGFIAGRLIQRLAADSERLLLLVQPAFVNRAQQEIVEIARAAKVPVERFRILEGDITQKNLGLSAGDLAAVREEATSVFHLAAIYDLAVKRDVALDINVGGTRNVNQVVRSLRKLRRYHYVSTCYVAGLRRGLIAESDLRHDAGFRNYYEESKHLAELEVEALKSELPVIIHRPSVVCGDSRTGETAKYDGIYYLINYLLRMPRFISLFNIGNRKVSLNLVPVDFVVEAIAALARDDRAVGKTIQIADPAPLTTHALFNSIARNINDRGSRITFPAPVVQFFLSLPGAPALTRLPHHAVPYFFLKQTYDTTEAGKLLAPYGVYCPSFSSYVDAIVDFAARHPALVVQR
ncbi:MAG: SDR family oxidoreductase [Acidobacteriota bacterium]|nr:SDR family oxidoreductase [Acidobacteriota bacterium]